MLNVNKAAATGPGFWPRDHPGSCQHQGQQIWRYVMIAGCGWQPAKAISHHHIATAGMRLPKPGHMGVHLACHMLAKWGFIEISQCNHIIIHMTVCLLCRLICPDADDSAALCKNELQISPDLRWQVTQLIGDLLTIIIGFGFGGTHPHTRNLW